MYINIWIANDGVRPNMFALLCFGWFETTRNVVIVKNSWDVFMEYVSHVYMTVIFLSAFFHRVSQYHVVGAPGKFVTGDPDH